MRAISGRPLHVTTDVRFPKAAVAHRWRASAIQPSRRPPSAQFGSQLEGTAERDSNVDRLVEREPDAHPTLLDLAQLEAELWQALGKQVDVRSSEDLSRLCRNQVLRTAEVQYVAG